MGELDGRVALVTGAGRRRGIGRATAVGLVAMGADVVVTVTGRDPTTFPEDEKRQAGVISRHGRGLAPLRTPRPDLGGRH